jgi:hypothetical protein
MTLFEYLDSNITFYQTFYCCIEGAEIVGERLIVIDFSRLVTTKTDTIDARELAERWARERFGQYKRRLCHPSLVIELPSQENS